MIDSLNDRSSLLSYVAHDELRFIRYAHSASIVAIQMLATNNEIRPHVETLFRINAGFLPVGDGAYSGAASRAIDVASDLVSSNFQVLRRSSLISLCAALEHLLKSVLVEWSEFAPEKIAGLEQVKISIHASDFLEAEQRDRLFLVADKLYQDASSAKSYFEKLRAIFRTHLPDQTAALAIELKNISENDVNEAFLIRNCLVHHGAKVSRFLSSRTEMEHGSPIILSAKSLGRYFDAIEKLADAVVSCSVTSL